MRCPHCSGEIPPGSHFCGICGGHVIEDKRDQRASMPMPAPVGDSGSLFDLPQRGGARRSRIALVVVLDLMLAGAGAAMMWSYFSARSEAASETAKERPTASVSRGAGGGDARPPTADEAKAASERGSAAKGGASDEDPRSGSKPDKPNDKPDDKPDKPDKPDDKPDKPDKPDDKGSAGAGSGSGAGTGSGSAGDPGGDGDGEGDGDGDGGGEEADEVGRFASRIEGMVIRNNGALARCYSQAAKAHNQEDPLAGRVEIRFRIMPTEAVERVRVENNSTGSAVLASCLVSHVSTWTFPDGPSSPLDFVWPFRFQPTN